MVKPAVNFAYDHAIDANRISTHVETTAAVKLRHRCSHSLPPPQWTEKREASDFLPVAVSCAGMFTTHA